MDKPEMPKEPIYITVTIRMKLIHDFDRYSNGSMQMRVSDCMTEIESEGKVVGSLGAALGGRVFVDVGNASYSIDDKTGMEFFAAVKAAHEATKG